jgi:hypothetical protein
LVPKGGRNATSDIRAFGQAVVRAVSVVLSSVKRLRFFLFEAVPALAGQGADAVRDAITRVIVALPEELYRSLTWDPGAEMAKHATLMIEYWHRDLVLRYAESSDPYGTRRSFRLTARQVNVQ